jgi:hypothetical protein
MEGGPDGACKGGLRVGRSELTGSYNDEDVVTSQ